jgi:hypothetical protein
MSEDGHILAAPARWLIIETTGGEPAEQEIAPGGIES